MIQFPLGDGEILGMDGLWIISICAISLGGLFGLYVYAWSIPTLQLFAPAILRGPADGNRIALTFDDGPCPGHTEPILDILRRYNVKATFFVCGQNVARSPELLRRIQAEGHAIGNHGYSHPFPFFRSRAFFAREIDLAQEIIEKVTGERPKFYRPPFGARWLGLQPVLQARGLSLVNWSDTGYDWKLDAKGIARETLKTLGPGSIILLHDGRNTYPPDRVDRSATVQALPAILEAAVEADFTFVSLDELLA
jgi:peptidoglycan/xylan/chitin deacetylase (PgdA/CDA1 family)